MDDGDVDGGRGGGAANWEQAEEVIVVKYTSLKHNSDLFLYLLLFQNEHAKQIVGSRLRTQISIFCNLSKRAVKLTKRLVLPVKQITQLHSTQHAEYKLRCSTRTPPELFPSILLLRPKEPIRRICGNFNLANQTADVRGNISTFLTKKIHVHSLVCRLLFLFCFLLLVLTCFK